MQSKESVLEKYRKEAAPDEMKAIRELWKRHSIAEDNRDIPGLLSTLTPDCVYEVVNTPFQWRGHEGATTFYRTLLGGIPDVKFELQEIVIGPQGVFEEAILTGTQKTALFGLAPTGKKIHAVVAILFPWDPQRRLFTGERIYLDVRTALT